MPSIQSDNCTPFVHIFDNVFLFAAELKELKIGISGKGLKTNVNFYTEQQNLTNVQIETISGNK